MLLKQASTDIIIPFQVKSSVIESVRRLTSNTCQSACDLFVQLFNLFFISYQPEKHIIPAHLQGNEVLQVHRLNNVSKHRMIR